MIELSVPTRRREEMIDVTEQVSAALAREQAADGHCLIYTPHTTCAVTVNEGYDPAVQQDFLAHMAELAPRESGWRHTEGNSDAHIKAMLVGTSAVVPISGGRLRLGRWQAVFLCEFDGPRTRSVWLDPR